MRNTFAFFFFVSKEPFLAPIVTLAGRDITFLDIFVGIVLVDYLLTIIIAALEKKPMLLVYGIGFGPLRIVDAFLTIYTLPLAFFVKSTGKWTSPQRS